MAILEELESDLCRNKQRKFDTGSSSLLTPHIISI